VALDGALVLGRLRLPAEHGRLAGKKFQELAGYIVLHECDVCGSVPTDYPAGNDVSKGELTFNFVTNSCSRKDSTDVCY